MGVMVVVGLLRRRGRGFAGRALVAVLLCLGLLSGQVPRAFASAPSMSYTVTYKGTYTFSDSYTPRRLSEEQVLTWRESETFVAVNGRIVSQQGTLDITGSLDASNQNGPMTDTEHCGYSTFPSAMGSFSLRPPVVGAPSPAVSVSAGIPSQAGAQVAQHGLTTGSYASARACVDPPGPGASLLISDANTSGGVNLNFTAKEQQAYLAAAGPGGNFLVDQLPTTRRFAASAMASSASETMSRTISSTLTVSLGGPNSLPHNTPERARQFARETWQKLTPIYEEAIYAIKIHVGVIIRANPPGKLLVSQTINQIYDSMIKTLALLESAYNDPPLAGYQTVAPVPKTLAPQLPASLCLSVSGSARGVCERDEAAAVAWIDAAASFEALASALATTVGRETAASNARDQAALALQQRAALALLPRLRAARTAEQLAAARFATAIPLTIRLNTAQTRQGIALVLAALARRGVSAQDVLNILAAKTLTPGPLDLLALLGGTRPANPPQASTPATIKASGAPPASASWSGRWQRAAGEYGAGSGVFTLAQDGTHVSGTYHWKGCGAAFGGSVVGTATGRSLTAVFNRTGDARGTLQLLLSVDGHQISGSYKVTAGCRNTYPAGRFDASYIGKIQ
jgi:hypothetical protein